MLPLAPNEQHIRQLSGKVLAARLTKGGTPAVGPFLDLGEVQRSSLTPELDLRRFFSNRSRKRTLVKQKTASIGFNFALTIDELSPENLAFFFLSERAEYTQAAVVAGTGELVAAATLGGIYHLPNKERNLTAIAMTVGATPLVEGEDYEIYSSSMGLIKILEGAPNVTAGATVDITSYACAAIVAGSGVDWIKVGTKPVIEVGLMILEDEDTDLADEPSMQTQFWRAAITPGGELPFITQDWANFTMNVAILDDTAGLYGGSIGLPYGQVLIAPAA